MKRIRRIYLWGSLTVLLALVAGVYTFSEKLLNDLLRPQLVALAAERLAAEVAVGRLSWHRGRFQIDDLRLRRPDNYALQVPRMRLQLRLGDLFERRLSAVDIDSPTLLLQPPSQASAPGGGFPSRLPVTIGRLVLRNGRIDYALPERSLTVRQVSAEIVGGEDYRFFLQAELGARDSVALQLSGHADWRRGLQLRLERCELGGRSLLADPLSLAVSAGDGVAGGGRLRLARFDRASFEQLRKGLQLPPILPAEWNFVLRDAELDFVLAEQALRLGFKLGEGRLQKDELTLPVDRLALALSMADNQWQGQGTFLLAGDNPGELSGRWSDGVLQGKLALQVAEPGRLKEQLLGGSPFAVAGAVRMTMEFSVRQGAGRAQFVLQGLAAGPGDKEHLLNLAPLRLRGAVQSGDDGVTGQARLAVSGRELLAVDGRPDRLQLKLLPSSWSQWRPLFGAGLRLRGLQGIGGLSGTLILERQTAGFWAVSGRIGSRRMTLFDDLQVDGLSSRLYLSGASSVSWSGNFSFAGQQLSTAGLELGDIAGKGRLAYRQGRLDVSKLSGAAQLTGPGQLSGRLAVAGSGFWRAGRWQARLASLQLQELEWLSDDGLAGLAGGRVAVSGHLKGVSGQPLDMKLQADLAAAEGLWGAYYSELSDLPIHLATRLTWRPASRLLLAEHWSASLARIGTASGSGRFGRRELRLTGDLQIPEVAGQGTDLLARLLGESQPVLAEAVFSGGLQVDFDLHKDVGWRLQGELRPQRLGLALPSVDLLLSGLAGRLPFDLAFSGAEPAVEAAPESGELRFEELRLGPARLAAAPLSLAVTTDRLAVQNPLVLEVAEGRITAKELLLGRVKEGLLLTGRFAIAGIDLQSLTADLGLAPMKGRLDADLGRIRYRGGLLRSEGKARIDAFGGQLRIGSIGLDISNLSYPQLTADLDFQAIDLYQLTQTFSFGAMNGIVDGYVHDLRLFGFTPAKFSALLESRLEGRRNISVKALNNLAILSQGGLSAALSRGIYRFIDFYRYRKIGIACELERDVFHLRGTAYPGSNRYLVYGGVLPPKIDIIAPPSAIAFSEMLKRLQRIERAD